MKFILEEPSKQEIKIPAPEPDDGLTEEFYAVDLGEGEKKFSRWFWWQWGLLFVAIIFFTSIFVGGFKHMHAYGPNQVGDNWIFMFTSTEMIFYAILLLCVPAAICFALGLEVFVPDRWIGRFKEIVFHPKWQRVLIGAMLGWTALAVIFTGVVVIKNQPTSDDENVYELQTRILASGRLSVDSLPSPDNIFQDNIFLVNNGKIFGQYPFGHSIFLLIGYFIGWIRLMPLLFTVASVLGMYLLMKDLYGHREGMLAALFLAVSPMVLFTGGTILSHSTEMFFLIYFFWFAWRTVKQSSLINPVLAGICYAAAFHVRSATAILIATPAIILLLIALLRRFKGNWLKTIVLGVVTMAGLGLYLWFNSHVNGDPFRTNYHAAWQGVTQYNSPFGFNRGAWNITHTPKRGFENMIHNLLRFNYWYIGWPLGLGFVILWIFKRKKKIYEYAAVITFVATYAFYFFYFWPGISDTGPVLYFELVIPVTVLAVPSLFWLLDFLAKKFGPALAEKRMLLTVLFAIILAFATFDQYKLRALSLLADRVSEPYRIFESKGIKNAVIFMDYYLKEDGQDSWVAGHKNSNQQLKEDIIYVLNLGADRDRLFMQKYFPDKEGYVFWYDNGKPVLLKLADYTVNSILKNFPDSR